MQQHGSAHGWTQQQQAWARDVMSMPLPPFHVNMHGVSCQEKNALSRVDGGGLGLGEPTEQMNRFLGVAGVVLQYTTLAGRALWLEVMFSSWNQRKAADLARVLVNAVCRAQARLLQLSDEQAGIRRQILATLRQLVEDGSLTIQEAQDVRSQVRIRCLTLALLRMRF